jgi:carboxypeptidase C (cathepsin A)
MRKTKNFALMLLAAAILLLGKPLFPAAPPDEPVVVTQHRIAMAGGTLAYSAETGRIAIRDVETGDPHGFIFYIAYRVPALPGETRPVTFVWNGGPGSNSAILHFLVAGPKRAEGERLVDNAETWLSFTDLVFVDPVGTGFSRPAKAEYAAEFYGTLGDTASITEFVRSWRLLHDADDAPLFLAGESWGAPRAATVGYALERRGIRVDGLVLISGGSCLNTAYIAPELKSALRVVDMALIAFHHGKTAPDLGKDFEEIRKTADDWARRTYAPALARVDRLTESERAAVIRELSRFTGIAAAEIDPKTLLIAPNAFRSGLLKGEGRTLATFDMRRSVPAGASPYLSEFKAGPAVVRYLRRDLGYRTDLPYLDLEEMEEGFAPSGTYPPDVNARWDYATAQISAEELQKALEEAARRGDGPPQIGPPLPATAEAVALNPRLKVLIASGLYDSYATCAANEETARRLPPDLRKAIAFKSYAGGHMMYLDHPVRLQFSEDVRSLIASSRMEKGTS